MKNFMFKMTDLNKQRLVLSPTEGRRHCCFLCSLDNNTYFIECGRYSRTIRLDILVYQVTVLDDGIALSDKFHSVMVPHPEEFSFDADFLRKTLKVKTEDAINNTWVRKHNAVKYLQNGENKR